MKYIPLSQNQCAPVDDDDYEFLIKHKWSLDQRKGIAYAVRSIRYGKRAENKTQKIYMHRVIMKPSNDQVVDHINHNGLDNRKANLRLCRQIDNSRNNRKKRGRTSKYRGVHFCNRTQRFVAQIRVCYKTVYLGRFIDEIAAAKAYDNAAMKYYGNYAKPNCPSRRGK